jgi:chromosome segregation ATPase
MADSSPKKAQVVQDQQTVSSDTSTPTAPQDTLTALQALLERQSERVDQLRGQIKMVADSMKSLVENDEQLSTAAVQADEASKKVKERKKTLVQSPEFRQHQTKSVELKDELKELEESLNSHLLSYYQQTGVKTFDTSGGGQREFKLIAKVLPKKGGKDE